MAAATSTFIFFTSRITFPPRPWEATGSVATMRKRRRESGC